MITLTHLRGERLVLNADLIESLESTPDTVITLISGKRIFVLETVEEVIELTLDYVRHKYSPDHGRPVGAQSD